MWGPGVLSDVERLSSVLAQVTTKCCGFIDSRKQVAFDFDF